MPLEIPEPDYDDPKEVYAFFGLAAYGAQILEQELMLLASVLHMGAAGPLTGKWVNELMDRIESKTFGGILSEARKFGTVPADVDALLADALRERNRLIHRFFADRATDFVSRVGRSEMIDELRAAIALFNAADTATTAIRRPLAEKLGIDATVAQALYEQVMAEAVSRDSDWIPDS
jgi:hypothetical protein